MSDYYIKTDIQSAYSKKGIIRIGDHVKCLNPNGTELISGIVSSFYRGNFGKGRVYAAIADQPRFRRYHAINSVRKTK